MIIFYSPACQFNSNFTVQLVIIGAVKNILHSCYKMSIVLGQAIQELQEHQQQMTFAMVML